MGGLLVVGIALCLLGVVGVLGARGRWRSGWAGAGDDRSSFNRRGDETVDDMIVLALFDDD